jgi:hypothetical protein
VFASVVPMQFVLVPAELATLPAARPDRLALLRQSWRIGAPTVATIAVLASVAARLGAEAPTKVLWPLVLTMTACATVTPLREHIRRVLHLAGISWHAAAMSLVQISGVVMAFGLLAWFDAPAIWQPFGGLPIATVVSLAAGLLLARQRQPPVTLPRYEVTRLMRSGRWLLAIEAITAGAVFLASVLVSRFDAPESLGYAEAARIVGQPLFVLAVGLSPVLNPRSIEAGAGRDRMAARRVARPYAVLLVAVGLAYGALTVTSWRGNPLGTLVPQAYVVAGLVPITVASFVLFGLPIISRFELTGASRERVLPQVGLAAVVQCAASLSAVWIGAFARPVGVALFGAVLLLGYAYQQRLVYATGDLALSNAGGRGGREG